jgi:hypothetical protein
MPRFIHIDTSIKSIGGHHWELAANIATTASELGWSASIITNIQFGNTAEKFGDLHNIKVIPVLNCPQSWRFSNNDMGGIRWQITKKGLPALSINPSKIVGMLSGIIKEPSINSTYSAFQLTKNAFLDLFVKEKFGQGDILFFGTACELDMLCFSEALKEYPYEICWHTAFYFHYGVFPSLKSSKVVPPRVRRENISNMLKQALKGLNLSKLTLFATTHQVAEQMSNFSGMPFEHLNYPINTICLAHYIYSFVFVEIILLAHRKYKNTAPLFKRYKN